MFLLIKWSKLLPSLFNKKITFIIVIYPDEKTVINNFSTKQQAMTSKWSRRDILRLAGLSATALPLSSWATNENGERIILPDNPQHKKLKKPVTAITLGAGSRGNVYGNYAVQYPDQLDIIGVAEPIAIRNERYYHINS